MKLFSHIRRVDAQVSILIIIATLVCSSVVFATIFSMTYSDMIVGLEERVNAIYEHVEDALIIQTFDDINDKDDINKDEYIQVKQILKQVKSATGVMYLYTAKKTIDGDFIYVIDGLDTAAADFRYPGDLIEHEIVPDMQRALNGEIVMPDKIKETDWGNIFITYLPIHNAEKEVIGVLGIEFQANHQHETYSLLLIIIPLITIVVILLATTTAVIIFRRISNPIYHDLSNTDQLTQLKNRNAYEIEFNNLEARRSKQNIGVIVIDLNNLKGVNDKFGHGRGDIYIQSAAQVLKNAMGKNMAVYRIGGDEYIILNTNATIADMVEYVNNSRKQLERFKKDIAVDLPLSFSAGYALFDEKIDTSLKDTFERADNLMYEDKQAYYYVLNRVENNENDA